MPPLEPLTGPCPACGEDTAGLVVTRTRPDGVVEPQISVRALTTGCEECRRLARREYARLEDLMLGGKGEACWSCGQPWARQRRKTLRDLEACPACLHRKLTGMKRMGGYSLMVARSYEKGREGMAEQETRALVAHDPKRAAVELRARFQKDLADPAAAEQFVRVAFTYGLDPFIGEIIPYQGRPYVTRAGWESLIHKRAPGQLVRMEVRLASKEEYEARKLDYQTDWLAIATVSRRYPDGREVSYTDEATITGKEVASANSFTPIAKEPQRHVQGRALCRALRELFRDVLTLPEIAGAWEEVDGQLVNTATGEIVESTAAGEPQANGSGDEAARKRAWKRVTDLVGPDAQDVLRTALGVTSLKGWVADGHTWEDLVPVAEWIAEHARRNDVPTIEAARVYAHEREEAAAHAAEAEQLPLA